jgi:Tfp pilus assembly protein PilO
MEMTEKDRRQLLGFAAVLAIGGVAAFWYFVHQPKTVEIASTRARIDSLTVQVDSARRDLARGSVEMLRERVAGYQGAVKLMRRLVPETGEVPNLIDDVSSRAKTRGVTISQLTPLAPEEGRPFQTHRYRFGVIGYYDQLGEFFSDVASLPRIMVPYDVTLAPLQASAQSKAQFKDSTGSLLEASFQLRTFAKPAVVDTTGGVE